MQKRVYVVGGVVRDYLLKDEYYPHKTVRFAQAHGRKAEVATDIDFLLPGVALPTARVIADQCGWAYYPLDQARDFARLVYQLPDEQLICDVAGLGLQTTSHLHVDQHEQLLAEALRTDLNERDFTINAMVFAFDLASANERTNRCGVDEYLESLSDTWFAADLIDLHKGRTDLREGIVRRVSPEAFIKDPVRLLRAVRFAVQLDFTIEDDTRRQLQELSATIERGSSERIRDELWKGLSTQDPATFIELLRSTGLLTYVLPEVANLVDTEQSSPHYQDVYQHTLLAVRHASRLRDWLLSLSLSSRNERVDEVPTNIERRFDDQHAGNLLLSKLKEWQQELAVHMQSLVSVGHRRAQWLVWQALLHDVGKPSCQSFEQTDDGAYRIRFFEHEKVGADLTKKRLETLHFSRQEIALTTAVVLGHMRPHWLHASAEVQPLSRRAMYRFFEATRVTKSDPKTQEPKATDDQLHIVQANQFTAGIDIALLVLADYQAIHADLPLVQWQHYLAHIGQLFDFAFSPGGLIQVVRNPLLNGHDLIQRLSMKPGPLLGQILQQLAEAQASGDVTTRQEALEYASKLLSSMDD
ncbi:HD domain-containing protein [Chloroflexi bacterium TSY]|nr:HD domain-containing protein [Chloroflexi bacterium TSY]